jgi:hypothetical protein
LEWARERGCPWDIQTMIRYKGMIIRRYCIGHAKKVVHWTWGRYQRA